MATLSSKSKGKAKQQTWWGRLLAFFTRNWYGRLIIGSVMLVALGLVFRSYLVNDFYPWARDGVLGAVGLGVYSLTLWALAFLGALRLKPRMVLDTWQWWTATALVVVALQTALGSLHGSDGVVADTTYGGVAGRWLWSEPLRGIPLIAGLLLLSAIIVWPRSFYRAAKEALRFAGRKILELTLAALKQIWKIIKAAPRKIWAWVLLLVRSPGGSAKSGADVADPLHDMEEIIYPDDEEEYSIEGSSAIDEEDTEDVEHPMPKEAGTILQWRPPGTGFLDNAPATVTDEKKEEEARRDVARRIKETLAEHGVDVEVKNEQIKPGPTVTLYGLTPGWKRRSRGNALKDEKGKPMEGREEEKTRVRVDAIVAREKDMALALSAPSLRIQAPVPGEAVVGIEVPNRNPALVALRSVLESEEFLALHRKGGLTLGLGQGSGGNSVVADLRRLPHLLIAGATGSGKSVCMNTLILSLACKVSPEKVRMLLIDPKRVELTPYNGLPHLMAPVVVDPEESVRALKGVIGEMKRRYRRMEELGVRNIEGYHRHPQALEPMPYLVIAVDELADLMMTSSHEVEQTLTRLAQLGRATGIHLIVATQRPSVNVVTGLIKANIPSRISFAVVSQVDSRTILDAAGAEKLLGRGDMLFLSGDTPKPQRVQGAFVSDKETETFMEHWREQSGPPLPEFDLKPEEPESKADGNGNGTAGGGPRDAMLDKAIELASSHSQLSTSLLQRRLRIGYPRAARLMDQLEDEGIVRRSE